MNDATPILELAGICKTYATGGGPAVPVLQDLNLDLRAGEIVALVAPSGAGKSTLLHIAGLLDTPDAGTVRVCGQDLSRAADKDRTQARRDDIGFVYQFHHLLPEFSARENIVLPQRAAGVPLKEATQRAEHLLSLVGLSERAAHRPAALSGGEGQRVAFCRAFANAPRLVLADEPTGNLDPTTSDVVFDTLVNLVRQEKRAALIATHNLELAQRMDRIVQLSGGKIAPLA